MSEQYWIYILAIVKARAISPPTESISNLICYTYEIGNSAITCLILHLVEPEAEL